MASAQRRRRKYCGRSSRGAASAGREGQDAAFADPPTSIVSCAPHGWPNLAVAEKRHFVAARIGIRSAHRNFSLGRRHMLNIAYRLIRPAYCAGTSAFGGLTA